MKSVHILKHNPNPCYFQILVYMKKAKSLVRHPSSSFFPSQMNEFFFIKF